MLRAALRQSRNARAACKEAFRNASKSSYTTGSKLAAGTSGSTLYATAAAAVVVASAVLAMQPLAQAKNARVSGAREKTYIMVKPDGVNRGLIGEIIKRFEQKGYKLVAIKVVVPTKELAGQHYAEHDGKPFFPKLVNFLSSGAVVGMVWEGDGVVKYGRTMIGATNPLASAPGTIRGDFAVSVGRNIVHGSDSVESAEREIALWFKSSEIADYEVSNVDWIYEYLAEFLITLAFVFAIAFTVA